MAVTSFLISTFLPYISYAQALGKQILAQQTTCLIDKGGENTLYIGAFLIVIANAVIVGALSRRLEHAVFTTLGLSLILIAFFFFIRQ